MEGDARRQRLRLLSLSSPAFVLVLIVLLIPVGWLFFLSFMDKDGFTLSHYARLWQNEAYFEIFRVTFLSSFLVTILTVVLGYPLAYLLAQLPRRLAIIGLTVVLLPFWTSLLVRTYAWLVLLQRKGLINSTLMSLGLIDEPLNLVYNMPGVVIGMTHIMLPFMVLPLYGTMRAIDRNLLRAAASLGSTPVHGFWTVFFPLSLPGLAAGASLVFVLCLGFYVTPAMLGGGKVTMVSNRIANDIELFFNWGAASALGVVLLVITLVVLVLAARLSRGAGLFGAGH
jgi:putative spermidine/putrescine transport system permease protein/spermidine/putrescine transport system permease protein